MVADRLFRVLCLVMVAMLPSAATADGLTLEHIAKIQRVTQAVVSPDGEHIAYTLRVPRIPGVEDDGPARSELHIIGPDGESRGYVTGDVSVRSLQWMPDSESVAFLTRRDNDKHRTLYHIRVDGGEAEPLARLETAIRGYHIGPDGDRVALIAEEPDPDDLVAEREMGFDQIIYEEDWKPRRLWIKDLTDGDVEMLEVDGSVQQVRWSPTGERLALQVTPRQLVDDTLMFKRIRIITPDGSEHGRIDNPGKLGEMSWSPDGERIAFIATESIQDTREGRLMVADHDGGPWDHLLPGLEGHVRNVGWLDPDRIVYVSHEGVESRLGVYDLDSHDDQTLHEHEGRIHRSMSVADTGRIACIVDTPEHPREVYALDADHEDMERLTDSNEWLSDVRLARQERLVYEARDGLDIEGLLVYPLDYEEGERYPLILAAHGGPESHYSNGWLTRYNLPAQHAAAEGYFMFYPNYRGSTGRGVWFTETSQARPAAEEFDDLVDGVDHLIDEGYVDEDRVGITGGSYGGYASAWAATYYSDRFAASVMNVGISDKISMLGTSDIPRELYLVHYFYWPWEDWDMFREASPIYHVEQAQTPILILHGDADPRVDPTQSRILYRYLELQDDPPPVRLVLYRGEGHSNQRAATRWDYSHRLMRWMDHFLIEGGEEKPDYRLDYNLPE